MSRSTILLVVLVACGSTPTPEVAPDPPPEETPTSVAAFVVYSATETVVVPVDGSESVVASGMWIQDDRPDGVELRHYHTLEGVDGGTPCACATQEGACSRESTFARRIDPATWQATPMGNALTECRCIVDESSSSEAEEEESRQATMWPADPPFEPPRADDEEEDDDEYEEDYAEEGDEECDQGDQADVSFYGGTLFSLGWYWNGACSGVSIYDSFSESTSRVTDALAAPRFGDDTYVGCHEDLMPASITDLDLPGDDLPCGPDSRDDESEDDDAELDEDWVPDGCGYCNEYSPEASVLALGRGYLWEISDNMFHAGGMRWYSRIPARADTCASTADPCGDPSAYPALVESGEDFWIATDGSAALDGSFAVHLRDGTTRDPVPFEGRIGVRFHADVTPLRNAMQRSPVRLPTASRPPTTARCDNDTACHWREMCGGFCGVDGQCHRAGECDAEHPCVGSDVCDEGRCGPEARIAEADAEFVDRRNGRGWGDRCVAHLRAGRLTHALAACKRGLVVATQDRVRGALLYNVGLIHTRRSRTAAARRSFQQSLRARPNNATVQGALDALPER